MPSDEYLDSEGKLHAEQPVWVPDGGAYEDKTETTDEKDADQMTQNAEPMPTAKGINNLQAIQTLSVGKPIYLIF